MVIVSNKLNRILRQAISLALAASLFSTSCPGVEAVPMLFHSSSRFNVLPQEIAGRSRTEALMEREIFVHSMADRSSSWKYLKTAGLLDAAHAARVSAGQKIKHSYGFLSMSIALASVSGAAWSLQHGGLMPEVVPTTFAYWGLFQSALTGVLSLLSPPGWLSQAIFNCGNYLVFGELSFEELEAMVRKPITDLVNRGIYSFGYSFQIPVRRTVPRRVQIPGFEETRKVIVWEYRVRKVFLWKREDAVQVAIKLIARDIRQARKEAVYLPRILSFDFHSRLGSVGSHGETVQQLEDAAQPGIAPPRGEPENWQLRWNAVEDKGGASRMAPQYVEVEHHFQFNGDISGTKGLHQSDPTEIARNQTARERYLRWLHYTGAPSGDAPMEALEMEMYYTERMWLPSVRYALFTYLVHPGDARDLNPPIQKMKQWEIFFHYAFRQWVQARPDVAQEFVKEQAADAESKSLNKAKAQQAKDFRKFLKKLVDPATAADAQARNDFLAMTNGNVSEALLQGIHDYLPDPRERDLLLTNATLAFWRNSLDYAALWEMKPRVVGTQAADYTSTLNPPGSRVMRVNTAQGQSLVAALSKDGRKATIASDRLVFQGLPDEMKELQLKLDNSANTSMVSGMTADRRLRVSVFRGVSNIPVSKEDLTAQRHLQPMKGGDVVAPNGVGLSPLEYTVRRSAMQIPKIHQLWQIVQRNLPGANLNRASEFTRVIIQGRIYQVLLRHLFQRDLPVGDLDAWAWEEADRLSREAWSLGKKEEEGALLAEIVRLADEQARSYDRFSFPTQRIDYDSLGKPYDLVYIATGKSGLAAEKSAMALKRTLGLRVRVISGNEYLGLANKYKEDIEGFIQELEVTRHTPIFIASDSGAETYEKNIASAYTKFVTEEPFGAAGSADNHLVDQFSPERVFSTENDGSKSQDGIPAYVSMIQLLQEINLFMADNITARFSSGIFFKTPFLHEEVVQYLIPSNEQFVRAVPHRVLGYTAEGSALDATPGSNDAANLREEGHRLAERHLEAPRKWAVVIGYALVVIGLVGGGIGVMTLGALPHLQHGRLADYGLQVIARVIDTAIDVSIGLSLLLIKRRYLAWTGKSDTKIFAGFALPNYLYVSPLKWVHAAMRDFAFVAQGLAYTSTKTTEYDADLKEVNDEYRAPGNRNTIVMLLRPGRKHTAFKNEDESAEQAGRHFKSQLSPPLPSWLKELAKLLRIKPVSPNVLMVGTHDAAASADEWTTMARDKDVRIAPPALAVPTGKTMADLPYHVAEYYLEQYIGFTWLLMALRIKASELDEVSRGVIGFFRYTAGRYLGGYAVKSTQAAVPGAPVLEAVERMAQRGPVRMVTIIPTDTSPSIPMKIPQTAVVFDSPPESMQWPQAATWLNATAHTHEHWEHRSRPATAQPGFLKGIDVLPPTEELKPVVKGVPAVHSSYDEDPLTAAEMQAFLDEEDDAMTSLIVKTEPPQARRKVIGEPISILEDGRLGPPPAGIDENVYKALDYLFKKAKKDNINFAEVLAGVKAVKVKGVVMAQGLHKTMEYVRPHKVLRGGGGLFIDADFVEDLIKASTHRTLRRPVQGAVPVGMLELREEYLHRDSEIRGMKNNRADEEAFVIREKVRRFLALPLSVRTATMKYLSSPENTFDPLKFGVRIYKLANDTYETILKANPSKEGNLTEDAKEKVTVLARETALEAIQDPVQKYIEEAFKFLEAAKEKSRKASLPQAVLPAVAARPAPSPASVSPTPAATTTTTASLASKPKTWWRLARARRGQLKTALDQSLFGSWSRLVEPFTLRLPLVFSKLDSRLKQANISRYLMIGTFVVMTSAVLFGWGLSSALDLHPPRPTAGTMAPVPAPALPNSPKAASSERVAPSKIETRASGGKIPVAPRTQQAAPEKILASPKAAPPAPVSSSRISKQPAAPASLPPTPKAVGIPKPANGKPWIIDPDQESAPQKNGLFLGSRNPIANGLGLLLIFLPWRGVLKRSRRLYARRGLQVSA